VNNQNDLDLIDFGSQWKRVTRNQRELLAMMASTWLLPRGKGFGVAKLTYAGRSKNACEQERFGILKNLDRKFQSFCFIA
jgi:hypothetical protein